MLISIKFYRCILVLVRRTKHQATKTVNNKSLNTHNFNNSREDLFQTGDTFVYVY